jgi:hypothetical protein
MSMKKAMLKVECSVMNETERYDLIDAIAKRQTESQSLEDLKSFYYAHVNYRLDNLSHKELLKEVDK